MSLTTKPDVVFKSGLASFKATMLSLFEDENEIIHYEDSPQNAMSDTAAMAVLKPSHIYRLLDTDLEDLLFLHIYVFPLFVPFLENNDFETYRNIMRLANLAFIIQRNCYTMTMGDPTQIPSIVCGKPGDPIQQLFPEAIQRDAILFTQALLY